MVLQLYSIDEEHIFRSYRVFFYWKKKVLIIILIFPLLFVLEIVAVPFDIILIAMMIAEDFFIVII